MFYMIFINDCQQKHFSDKSEKKKLYRERKERSLSLKNTAQNMYLLLLRCDLSMRESRGE